MSFLGLATAEVHCTCRSHIWRIQPSDFFSDQMPTLTWAKRLLPLMIQHSVYDQFILVCMIWQVDVGRFDLPPRKSACRTFPVLEITHPEWWTSVVVMRWVSRDWTLGAWLFPNWQNTQNKVSSTIFGLHIHDSSRMINYTCQQTPDRTHPKYYAALRYWWHWSIWPLYSASRV